MRAEKTETLMAADEYAKRRLLAGNAHFRKTRPATRAAVAIVDNFIRVLRSIIGTELYVVLEDKERLHIQVSPQMHAVAGLLEKEGIITNMNRIMPPADWPQTLVSFEPAMNAIRAPSGGKIVLRGFTGGSSFDLESAFRAALAETVERYSLFFYEKRNIISGSFDDLKERGAVPPARLRYFSEEQLEKNKKLREAFPHFDEHTIFSWTKARTFQDGRQCLIPAQLAHFAFRRKAEEPLIREVNTNGAGAGDSFERAVYASLCEALERDAILIHYLNKLAPPCIDNASITNEKVQEVLADCARRRIEVSFLDVTTDIGVPTILCLIIDRSGKNIAVRVSGKADLDVEKAVVGALQEGLKRGGMMRFDAEIQRPQAENLDVITRFIFWSFPEMIPKMEFLTKGRRVALSRNKFRGADFAVKLRALRAIFKENNLDSYIVDVTSHVARRVGLHVVITVTPDLYPLYLQEKNKYLGPRRLYDVPVKLGYYRHPKKEYELNAVPHPIP